MTPDVIVADESSVLVFHPQTNDATAWLEENVSVPEWARLGEGFAADHRAGRHLVAAYSSRR